MARAICLDFITLSLTDFGFAGVRIDTLSGLTTTAYLGLGSNLGDRAANLREALRRIAETAGEVVRVSAFYETEPMELTAQPWFLNAVAELRTALGPRQLLSTLLEIETSMGRVRIQDKGPRLIDLDILLFGQTVLNRPGLTLPHPALPQRRFVLAPLSEIAPNLIHPVLQRTIRELWEKLPPEAGEVRKLPL